MDIRCSLAIALSLVACADERPGAWSLPAVRSDATSTKCVGCHGSGPPPGWALDASRVEAVAVDKGYLYYGGGEGWGEELVVFGADGGARRELDVDGRQEASMAEFVGGTEDVVQTAVLTQDAWAALAQHVVETGLFRFHGEEVVAIATHHPSRMVEVRWRDGTVSSLVSLQPDDPHHPSFDALVAWLDDVEASLTWYDEPSAGDR